MASWWWFMLRLGWTVSVARSAPTIQVLNGTLLGAKCATTNVNRFFSIPYAKPPIGNRRFKAPEPLEQGYVLPRDASIRAPACPQFSVGFSEVTPQSEDCLFLDIWVPATATPTSKLPVRVWLYGGGNSAGGISNPLYDGCQASVDLIQVSINYRLGPLGFLALESLGLSGNYGIQDQLLGLQWIQENIASFGGDPSRVVLFGESAGATDSCILSTLPTATSLFRSVILQSGAFSRLPSLAEAKQVNELFVKSLKCDVSDLNCVLGASLAAMNATFLGIIGKLEFGSYLSPVFDGKVVPVQPMDAGIQVPAIIGSTTNEGALFFMMAYGNLVQTLDQSVYDSFLNEEFGTAASKVGQKYPIARFTSTANTSYAPVFNAMSILATQAVFRCPARRLLQSSKKPVWTYSFGHTPSCAWYPILSQQSLPLLGPTHTSDMPFVMGWMDGLPRPAGSCSMTVAERGISAKMQDAWNNMASIGNPGSDWPVYSASNPRGVNIEGDNWSVGTVDYSMCDFWDEIQAEQVAATSTATSPGASSTSSGNHGNSAVIPATPATAAALARIATCLLIILFWM